MYLDSRAAVKICHHASVGVVHERYGAISVGEALGVMAGDVVEVIVKREVEEKIATTSKFD